MRWMPALLLGWVIMISGVISHSFAGETEYVEATGFWSQLVGEGNLSSISPELSQVRLWLEGQARFNHNNPHDNMNWYQGVARAAVGYAITDRLTVWTGYTYVPTQLHDKPAIGEQHVWPAARYIFPTQLGTMMLREMLEARFVGRDDPGYRSRTLIRLLHPFEFEPRLSCIVWDEAFFNLNDVPDNLLMGTSGFNQNRAFAGLGWTLNQNVRAELGYMNMIVNTSRPHSDTTVFGVQHTILGSVFMGW